MPFGPYDEMPMGAAGDPFAEPEDSEVLKRALMRKRVEDAQRLAALQDARNQEMREATKSIAYTPDMQLPDPDRSMIMDAVKRAQFGDSMTLNPGMARHLSYVGREPPPPPPDRDEMAANAAAALRDRLMMLKGESGAQDQIDNPLFGKYREGSLGVGPNGAERRPVAGRFEDPSGTSVMHTDDGGIMMKGGDRETYNIGGKELSRADYFAQRDAGIKAARQRQHAGADKRKELFWKDQEQNTQPVEGLGGMTPNQAQDMPLLAAIAAAHRAKGGEMDPRFEFLRQQEQQQKREYIAAKIATAASEEEKKYWQAQLDALSLGGVPPYQPPSQTPKAPVPPAGPLGYQFNSPLPSTMPPSLRPPGY